MNARDRRFYGTILCGAAFFAVVMWLVIWEQSLPPDSVTWYAHGYR